MIFGIEILFCTRNLTFNVWTPILHPIGIMQNWKKIKEVKVYEGYRNIIRKTFELPTNLIIDFDIVDVRSFVCIAAITEDQKIILVEQYRPGPEMVMLSFAEGQIEKGENPVEAVERELLEETGFRAKEVMFLREIPEAYSQIKKRIYLAKDCIKIQNQRLDDSEFIQVNLLSIEEFRNLLQNKNSNNFNSIDAGYMLLDSLGLI